MKIKNNSSIYLDMNKLMSIFVLNSTRHASRQISTLWRVFDFYMGSI
ncbi:MAG TPA: hypothetical protein VIK29_00685 [Paludibacter sp.]